MSEKRSAIQLTINNGEPINTTIRDAFQKLVDVIDSFANENDALTAERDLLRRQLDKAMDYINDLADNGFEKARGLKKEIEGMK